MLGDDIISVQEAEMSLFVEEHRHRWAADELNYRSFLSFDASDNASFRVYKKLGFKVKSKMANFRKV